MRIAALFCGLIAGLFALLAPVGLGHDLLTPFLKLWGPTEGQQLLGTVGWYAPAAAAILGALLASVAPGLGALLLLAASIGWGAIGVYDTSFLRLELLVPAAASLLGSLLAFLAGELELRRRRAARRSRIAEMEEDSEMRAREAAFTMDPLRVPREEAPPRPSREIPLTLDDVVPEPPVPPRRSETIWPDSPGRRSMFDRGDGPDLSPRRSLFDRPATRVERPTPERVRLQPRPEKLYDDDAPRRSLLPWLVAANGIVVIGLAIAVGYMLIQRAPVPAAAVANTDTPAVSAPAAAPAPVAAIAEERLTPNNWPALALPGEPQPQQPQSLAATVGQAVASLTDPTPTASIISGSAMADPHAYCSAVGTIDYVDNRYTGPRFTAEIADALRVPMESAPDRVSWRCVDGVVYACASFDWPVCGMTPTAQEMLEYCRRNPGVTRLLAPNGTWSCEGNRPRLPDGASWPIDARGFFPPAWIPVVPSQRPTG